MHSPVVLARIPQYVVPFTVLPSTCCTKLMSLDTTAAVRWLVMRSRASRTRGSSPSLYSVTTYANKTESHEWPRVSGHR